MEIRVESAEGYSLPASCYVGVRVGDILKQGKYEPQRCYNFPNLERRRNAKIDIYQHIGSCVVAVEPDAKSAHEVTVACNDSSAPPMRLKVNVQTHAEESGKKRDHMTKAVKSQAKDYLMKHGVEERLADAVKALLKAQPSNPTEFLCRQLRGEAEEPSKQTNQVDTVNQSSSVVPPAPDVAKEAAPARKDLNTIRQEACNVLMQASNDGTLNTVLQEVRQGQEVKPQPAEPQDLNAIRQEACKVLMEASSGGTLNSVLQEIRQEREVEQQAAKPQVGPVTKDLNQIRMEACDVLMKASIDGTLNNVLKEVRNASTQPGASTIAQQAASAQPAAAAPPPASNSRVDTPDLKTLRHQACDVLMTASADGSLVSALNEVRQERKVVRKEMPMEVVNNAIYQAQRDSGMHAIQTFHFAPEMGPVMMFI